MTACWDFVRKVYEEKYGISLPSLDGIESPEEAERIVHDFMRAERPEVGDIVVFAGHPHVGIYLGDSLFVHMTKHGPRVDRVGRFWRIVAVYRYRGPRCP